MIILKLLLPFFVAGYTSLVFEYNKRKCNHQIRMEGVLNQVH